MAEITYALPDEIFCLARVGHGTHNFDRWVHLDFIYEDGDLSNSDRNRFQKHPFSFLCLSQNNGCVIQPFGKLCSSNITLQI